MASDIVCTKKSFLAAPIGSILQYAPANVRPHSAVNGLVAPAIVGSGKVFPTHSACEWPQVSMCSRVVLEGEGSGEFLGALRAAEYGLCCLLCALLWREREVDISSGIQDVGLKHVLPQSLFRAVAHHGHRAV